MKFRKVSLCSVPNLFIGLIAAGRHGLKEKLSLPEPFSKTPQIPESLVDALTCLEEDDVLCDLLDKEFVERYIDAKRGNEIRALAAEGPKDSQEKLKLEQKMYLKLL